MATTSNVELSAFEVINSLATSMIDSDNPADDFIRFVTQPGFVDLTQDDDSEDEQPPPTVIPPDSTLSEVSNQTGPRVLTLDPCAETCDEPPRKIRKTVHCSPPNSPELFHGSDKSEDDAASYVASWDTQQLNAWDQSSWASEPGELTIANAGQTPYSSPQSSSSLEEEIDVEEVAATPQSVDVPATDSALLRTLINSLDTVVQQNRHVNNRLNAIHEVQIENRDRLVAFHNELRSYQLEIHSRLDGQDRFIQGLGNEIFYHIHNMQLAIDDDAVRNEQILILYQREMMRAFHPS